MTPAEPEHNGKDGRDMLYETIAFPDNAPLQCSIVEVEEYPFHMHDDVLEIMFAWRAPLSSQWSTTCWT